jgi:chromosome segregation ATPase
MTDYTDLIARLRFFDTQVANSCADAITDLEAELQVSLHVNDQLRARVAELEAEIEHLEQNFTEWLKEYRKAADAIEELMAALKPFADKADKAEGPFEPPYPVDYSLWRAARAAYLGEKND